MKNTDTKEYLENYIKLIKKEALRLIKAPVPKATREAYMLYFETGSRLTFEKQYFAVREQLTVFGLMVSLWEDTGADKECAARLLHVIKSVLNENTWVLPAHGSREHIDGKVQSIDLFSAETGGSLSEILYLIKDNPAIRDNFYNEYRNICLTFIKLLRIRIFNIFLEKNPCDWWEGGTTNWTSVCISNVVISGYYAGLIGSDVLGENPRNILSVNEYGEIMERAAASMACYIRSMEAGVCTEGCGYYKYGMEYFLKFHEILSQEKNIYINPRDKLKLIGEFKEPALFLQRIYLGMGNSVNFADSAVKNKMKLGIISYLSYMYDEVELSDDFFNYSNKSILSGEFKYTETLGGEECHRWLGGYSDYMWVKKYGKYLKCQADCKEHMFENNMWYIKRWKDKTGFYIKGGNNNESHNHNDVGSFGYIVRGEEMLCDLGAGEYTRDYFGKNRYEILCNSSEGHNVPIVDGKYQLTGDTARAESFYLKADSLIITYGAAYGLRPECVKRKIIFKGEDGFTICDSYCNVKRITESFITKLVPVINGNTVMLKGDSGGISMDFKGHMGLYVREKIHNDHDGNKVRVYIIKADYINNETAYVIEINIKRL